MMVKKVFQKVVENIKSSLLCCKKNGRKRSLDIGSPYDARKVVSLDIIETMNLAEADASANLIGETPHVAIAHHHARLLSLQSHPPTQPTTPSTTTTSNFFLSAHPSHSHLPPSTPSSPRTRSPSVPLLNAASTNLPAIVPTPPRQKHSDASSPAFRMKSMWERTRRLSEGLSRRSSSGGGGGYLELDSSTGIGGRGEEVLMLELEFEGSADDKKSLMSVEGFEMQDVLGGTPTKKGGDVNVNANGAVRKGGVRSAVGDKEMGDSSESEGELFGVERKPLVKV